MMRHSQIATLLLLAACADRPAETPAPGASDAPPPAAETAAPAAAPAHPPGPPIGTLCPNPEQPCPGFPQHDLSFVLPTDSVARDENTSEEFFAVLLRSGPACSIDEAQRAAAQTAFPGRKVFAHRFECDPESNVTYEGADGGLAFLAVYAGRARPQADSVLALAGAYPGANLRRMRVKFVYP